MLGVEVGADDFGRELRDDRVTVGAQASHSVGYPISQEGKAGLSAPRFSVCPGEPDVVGPEGAVTLAASVSVMKFCPP